MKKIMIRVILSMFIVFYCFFLFTSCIKDPEFVALKEIEFTSIEDSIATVEIISIIRNWHKLGATITKINADIFINDVYVGIAESDQKIKIKGNDTSSVSVVSKLKLPVLSTLFSEIMKADSSIVRIEGDYWISMGLGSFKFKSTTQSQLSIRKEVESQIQSKISKNGISITHLKPKNITFDSSFVDIKVKFLNDMDIDYEVISADVDLFMPNQNKAFGQWLLKAPKLIRRHTTEQIEATVEIQNLEIIRQSILSIFSKKVVYARGNAEISIGNYPFKIPLNQQVSLLSF